MSKELAKVEQPFDVTAIEDITIERWSPPERLHTVAAWDLVPARQTAALNATRAVGEQALARALAELPPRSAVAFIYRFPQTSSALRFVGRADTGQKRHQQPIDASYQILTAEFGDFPCLLRPGADAG